MADPKDPGLSVDDILGPELSAKLTNKSKPAEKPAVPAPPAAPKAAAPAPAAGAAKAPLPSPTPGAKPAVPAAPRAPAAPAPKPAASAAKPAAVPSAAAAGAPAPSPVKSGVVAAPFAPATGPVAPAAPKPIGPEGTGGAMSPDKTPAPSASAVAAANAPLAAAPAPPVAVESEAAPPRGEETDIIERPAPSEETQVGAAPVGRTTDELARSLMNKMPPFPGASLKAAARDLAGWIGALPIVHKTAGAVLLVLLLVALVLAARRGGQEARWVSEEQTLWAGPASNTFEEVALLEPNEAVRVIASEGDYALVRDSIGRVGFVLGAYLADAPLEVTPEQPFTRCTRRPTEPDVSACHGRGHAQLASCQEHCAGAASPADCSKLCDARLRSCIESCDQPAAAPPPAAAAALPTPAVEPPAAEVAAPEEPPPPETTKSAKRKGRRKALRKRRKR